MPDNNVQVNTDFELSAKQLWEEIAALVREEKIVTDCGYAYSRYCLADIDIQNNEIIVWDWSDNDRLYGLSYTKENDKIVIDWSSKKRKKIEYADWQEGDVVAEFPLDFASEINNIEDFTQKKINDLTNENETLEKNNQDFQAKYQDLETKYNEMEPKYNDFVAAAEKAEIEALENQKLEIFSKYESALLADEKAKVQFEEYKKNRKEMTPEEIEGKCAVLYAQVSLFSAKENKQSTLTATVFSANNEEPEHNSRYGVIIKS